MRAKVTRPLIPALVVAFAVILAKTVFETNATLKMLGVTASALPWKQLGPLMVRAFLRPVHFSLFLNLAGLLYFLVWCLLRAGLFTSKPYRSPKARKALHEP